MTWYIPPVSMDPSALAGLIGPDATDEDIQRLLEALKTTHERRQAELSQASARQRLGLELQKTSGTLKGSNPKDVPTWDMLPKGEQVQQRIQNFANIAPLLMGLVPAAADSMALPRWHPTERPALGEVSNFRAPDYSADVPGQKFLSAQASDNSSGAQLPRPTNQPRPGFVGDAKMLKQRLNILQRPPLQYGYKLPRFGPSSSFERNFTPPDLSAGVDSIAEVPSLADEGPSFQPKSPRSVRGKSLAAEDIVNMNERDVRDFFDQLPRAQRGPSKVGTPEQRADTYIEGWKVRALKR